MMEKKFIFIFLRLEVLTPLNISITQKSQNCSFELPFQLPIGRKRHTYLHDVVNNGELLVPISKYELV
jgi:hypothetical protein